MSEPASALPSLQPIPADISDRFRHLLHHPPADREALAAWLLELVKSSGHLSNADDLRWRVLALVWLAHLAPDAAWPYLMWLNMNQPVIQEHLADILAEALDEYDAHLRFAAWRAAASDPRLPVFWGDFRAVPSAHRLPDVFRRLLADPLAEGVAPWLVDFCTATADPPPSLRRWHLLAAALLAARLDPDAGQSFLLKLAGGRDRLPDDDLHLLDSAAGEVGAVNLLVQWLAEEAGPPVQRLLAGFGHPDLPTLARQALDAAPDYHHLTGLADRAAADAALFQRVQSLLAGAGLSGTARVLNLACGLLAPQTVLLAAAGYRVVGVDMHIPPHSLPVAGLKMWLKRRRHVQAWQSAAAAYYRALAGHVGLKLNWKRAPVELADLTRLRFADSSFDAVVCLDYLHHAPDVRGLLAEAARVLKPGGLLLVSLRPFPSLGGAFAPPDAPPWGHLRGQPVNPQVPLNRWTEARYRQAVEAFFTVEQWLTEQDEQALALLAPALQAELSSFSADELTRREVTILARKPLPEGNP